MGVFTCGLLGLGRRLRGVDPLDPHSRGNHGRMLMLLLLVLVLLRGQLHLEKIYI